MATLTPSMLHALQYLAKIVDAGSFAEAARRTGVTTSAMSKAVTRLEAACGTRLLHRTTHAVSLTPAGERVLAASREMIREAERVGEAIEHARESGPSGCVRLSAPGPMIRSCVVPLLPDFRRRWPRIELELKLDDSTLDLAAEGIDIALRVGAPTGQAKLMSRRVASFHWVLCASRSLADEISTPAVPSDLDAMPHIAFRHVSDGQIIPWRLRDPSGGDEIRYQPKRQLVAEDLTAISNLIEDGLGIGWVPNWCVAKAIEAQRVVELLPDLRGRPSDVYAVRLQSGETPRRLRLVMDEIAAGISSTIR